MSCAPAVVEVIEWCLCRVAVVRSGEGLNVGSGENKLEVIREDDVTATRLTCARAWRCFACGLAAVQRGREVAVLVVVDGYE